MAVGLERAHAQILGQGQGLLVVGFGLCDIRGIATCGDLTKQAQSPCFESASLLGARERKRALSLGNRLLHAAGQQIALTQASDKERMPGQVSRVAARPSACSSSGSASAIRPDSAYP